MKLKPPRTVRERELAIALRDLRADLKAARKPTPEGHLARGVHAHLANLAAYQGTIHNEVKALREELRAAVARKPNAVLAQINEKLEMIGGDIDKIHQVIGRLSTRFPTVPMVDPADWGKLVPEACEIERLRTTLKQAHDLLEEAVKIAYSSPLEGNLTAPWLQRVTTHFKVSVAAAEEPI